MSNDSDKVKVAKLIKLLTGGDSAASHVANIINKISVKESEQIRPIIPARQWIEDDYYVGRDASKLYPFWKDLICDIFDFVII